MPKTTIPPLDTIGDFFEPLVWHPDLAIDLQHCAPAIDEARKQEQKLRRPLAAAWEAIRSATRLSLEEALRAVDAESPGSDWRALKKLIPGAGDEGLQEFVSIGRAYQHRGSRVETAASRWIEDRYTRIWRRAPATGSGWHLAIRMASVTGAWETGLKFALTAGDPGTYPILFEVFPDAACVRPLLRQEGVRLIPADLYPGEYSQLVDSPAYDGLRHPAIVIHPLRYGTLEQAQQALAAAWPLAQVPPPPAQRERGRVVNMRGRVALYRLWWEYRRLCESRGEEATHYAFARKHPWQLLPPKLIEDLSPHIAWWRKKSAKNREAALSMREMGWLMPDAAIPSLERYIRRATPSINLSD